MLLRAFYRLTDVRTLTSDICLLRKKMVREVGEWSLGNREVGRRWGRGNCDQNIYIYMKNILFKRKRIPVA